MIALRLAKGVFYVVGLAPLALVSERKRDRWKVNLQVFAWHLRGCPRNVGLGGSRTQSPPVAAREEATP